MSRSADRRDVAAADTLSGTGVTWSPGASAPGGKGFPQQDWGSSLVRAGLVTVPVPAGGISLGQQLWCDRADCPVSLFTQPQPCPGCGSDGYRIPTLNELPEAAQRVLAPAGLGR